MVEQMPKTGAEERPEGYLDAKPGDTVRARFPEMGGVKEEGKPKDVILEGFEKGKDGSEMKDERGLRIAIVRIIDPEDPRFKDPRPIYISEGLLEKIVGLREPSEDTAPFDPDAVS